MTTRSNTIQTNFTGGEFKPQMDPRVDLSRYFNGGRTFFNVISPVSDGAKNRSGSYYAGEAIDPEDYSQLVDFEYSELQAYILEVGNGLTQFYRDGGQVESGGSPYQLATPWVNGESEEIDWTQSMDVLYVTHRSHKVRTINRFADDNWDVRTPVTRDGPYQSVNLDGDKKITPSATGTGSQPISADFDIFVSTDVGRLIRLRVDGQDWAWGTITAVADARNATVDFETAPGATNATDNWRLGAWSDTTGYPRVCIFYENRVFFFATDAEPNAWWFTIIGGYSPDLLIFEPSDPDGTVTAESGGSFILQSGKANHIHSVASGKSLIAFSDGSEWQISSGTSGIALSVEDISIVNESEYGSSPRSKPNRIGEAVLFMSRDQRQVREWLFSLNIEGYLAPNLIELASHLAVFKFWESSFQLHPTPILWLARGDGHLVGMTYDRGQEVVGWHRHVLGGNYQGDTAFIESIRVIPGEDDGTGDTLWMTVKRTINGVTKKYVEWLTPEFRDEIAQEDLFFVDSGLIYDGAPTTTITGLDHLEGETVAVFGDSADRGDYVVSAGSINLDTPISKAAVGLVYRAELETMDLEPANPEGTSKGQTKRVVDTDIFFHRSLGVKYTAGGEEYDLTWYDAEDDHSKPAELFSGVKNVDWPKGWSNDVTLKFVQNRPLPMNITGLVSRTAVR